MPDREALTGQSHREEREVDELRRLARRIDSLNREVRIVGDDIERGDDDWGWTPSWAERIDEAFELLDGLVADLDFAAEVLDRNVS